MSWRLLILIACAVAQLVTAGCGKKSDPARGLIGHWKVVEQQRDDKCRFTAQELYFHADGRIQMSSIPESEMRYLTNVAPDHFERLKKKYPNIEQGNTIVVVMAKQPKNQPMMGMAYRYVLKDRDTLIVEYDGCRATAYQRAR